MSVKIPDRPTAWVCRTCLRVDFEDVEEALAFPDHVPHRGCDIGMCSGEFEPVYSADAIREANREE